MKCWSVGLLSALILISISSYADDLMQIYQQALRSDPIFAQAKSTWESEKMDLPIARAGYLPQLSATGDADRVYDYGKIGSVGAGTRSWKYGYSLTLTQPIFNFSAWSSIKNASASVKAATATYLAAQQSLMQRVATAYFNVLQAYDQLRYTVANKRAVWEQYVTAREQFKVGLIAVTDEYDARSSYDQVVAKQIAAQNNLNIQLENLRAITGREYGALNGLGKLPMLRPKPDNIDQWVNVATQQNYGLKAQNYTVLAAMETIKQKAGGGLPVLNAEGTYTDTRERGIAAPTIDQTATVGLGLTYNPIQGGAVIASTKQARYDYVTASGKLEQVHRDVVNQSRSNFLSVLSGISRVKADKQSILSARNSLESTQAGFHVGTRTMADVLNALSTLYQAQQQYANDQYDYINNLIALKVAAGTLSVDDLTEINSWLGKAIRFPEQTSVGQVPTENNARDLKVKINNESMNNSVRDNPVVKNNVTIEKKQKKIISGNKTAVISKIKLIAPAQTMLPQPAAT